LTVSKTAQITWDDDIPVTLTVQLYRQALFTAANISNSRTITYTGALPYSGTATIKILDSKGRSDQVEVLAIVNK
jgi:hypothetical protein